MPETLRLPFSRPLVVSEREQAILKLAPVAKAYLYEAGRVDDPTLDPLKRVRAKILRDAFEDFMIDEERKGGTILKDLRAFQEWDFERQYERERSAP